LRWQAIDPLLPEPSEPTSACGKDLTVTSPDGQLLAAGSCRHVNLKPESLTLAWGAAHQLILTPWVVGPDVRSGLGALLQHWGRHVARQREAAEEDSSAIVRWPSRDVEGVRALLDHGLRPLTIIAARLAGRAAADGGVRVAGGAGGAADDAVSAGAGAIQIRPAGPGDLDDLERLGMEMMRYDAHFGSVTVRPDTARLVRESDARNLESGRSWILVAERGGEIVGMAQVDPPEAAGWVTPLTSAQPVAYVGEMSVLPGARGTGIGTALVRHLHRELDATGAAVTLLHHAQLNPLSVPFWSRMGYRPLWSSWEIRPADGLA
jgi:GNAT superfamily N-acetyltransferase